MIDDSLTREILGNIDSISRSLFYLLTTVSTACFAWGILRRARLWRLGRRTETIAWRSHLIRYFKKALSQRPQCATRRQANLAHRFLFGGFGLLLIGTALIAIEHYGAAVLGRGADEPIFHKGLYFAVYEIVLDTAGIAVLVGCFWFVWRRRRRAGSPHGRSGTHSTRTSVRGENGHSIGHSRLDWVVLGTLVLLCVTGYLTEGLRIIREETPQPGFSYVGYGCGQLLRILGTTRAGSASLHFGLWWFHAVLALGFVAAFPFTRLFHAIAGSLSVATDHFLPGVMTPVTIEEVERTGRFGVGRVQDFTRRQLLELDACVSCGRCQDVCPAHQAGKPLSPRDAVQEMRARFNQAAPALLMNREEDDLPALTGVTIAAETAWSCTTCHACVDVCPLSVNPLGMLTDMRRNLVGEGHLRGAPASALQKMQRSGNPWGLPAAERLRWASGLDVSLAADTGEFELLYWIGCAAAYDPRSQEVARAMVQLLRAANVDFAVLGPEERCTGESARRLGDEFLYQELAASNLQSFDRYRVQKIVTHCPHCLNSFKNDYPQLGARFEVKHHTELLNELVQAGKLPGVGEATAGGGRRLTYHDPCYLARVNDIIEPPRQLLSGDCQQLSEMPRRGHQTSCCGAGGGRMWFDDAPAERVGVGRVAEAMATGADTVAVSCPFCLTMMSDGLAAQNASAQAKDVAELLAETLDFNQA